MPIISDDLSGFPFDLDLVSVVGVLGRLHGATRAEGANGVAGVLSGLVGDTAGPTGVNGTLRGLRGVAFGDFGAGAICSGELGALYGYAEGELLAPEYCFVQGYLQVLNGFAIALSGEVGTVEGVIGPLTGYSSESGAAEVHGRLGELWGVGSGNWPPLPTVLASHRAEYYFDLPFVRRSYAALWGCRAAAQHEFPISYSQAVYFSFPYDSTSPVPQVWQELGYRIADTGAVKAQNDMGWALRVSRVSEYPYAMRASVEAFNSLEYSIEDIASVSALRKQTSFPYAGISPVASQAQINYALLTTNPVRAQLDSYYAMRDYLATLVENSVVRVIFDDGTVVIVDDGVIDSADGDVGYSFECAITDLRIFILAKEDAPIVVDFCGELYNFFINGKSLTRNSGVDVSFRMTATNQIIRLGPPYSPATDYIQDVTKLVSEVVDDLIEIDFNYEILDWTLPVGRFVVDQPRRVQDVQSSGTTPLDAVKQIAEAAGAVVDGDREGNMRIRYPYPYPMNELQNTTVDQNYSDDYDNLSVSINVEHRDGANHFRVREGDASFSDSFEWTPDEVQANPDLETGILKAYLSPYRTTATIRHLGNAVTVQMLGEKTEFKEELIEFKEGVGDTQRPIYELLSVEWITANMGVPTFAQFSTMLNVSTSVNSGYGLAKVTYNAKHLTAKAAGVPATTDAYGIGPAGSYAYFILEESSGN